MQEWWLNLRRAIADFINPADSPAQRKLYAKGKIYKALDRIPRGEALELLCEIVAETVAPLANQAAIQARTPEVVALAVGLDTSDFIYLMSDATRQYLQQKVLANTSNLP